MIGYYAHSHGSGHCNYANLFSQVFGKSLTVFTDRNHPFDPGVDVIRLDDEDPDGSEFDRNSFPEPRALHYAPVNIKKITERNRAILDAIIRKNIRLLIVDVSVEIAMLARISSVPYAYVRLQGNRNDLPHLNAYEGASFLLAYYPEEMENPDTPPWIRKKTVYLGFLSRYMFETGISVKPLEYKKAKKPVLLHLSGFGGTLPLNFSGLSASYSIYSIGPGRACNEHSDIVHIGVVTCTRAFIEHADVVVAACGSNTTSEILSLGKRFLAVPEERHYQEQERLAEILDTLGWAIDLSKYGNLQEALSAFENGGGMGLPTVNSDRLLGFGKLLKGVEFRADRVLVLYRKQRKRIPVWKPIKRYPSHFRCSMP